MSRKALPSPLRLLSMQRSRYPMICKRGGDHSNSLCYGESMQATAFGMEEYPYVYCAITTSWPESDQRGVVIEWKTTKTDFRYSGLAGLGDHVVMGSTPPGAIPTTTAVTTKEITLEEARQGLSFNPPSRGNAQTSSEVKATGSSSHIATPTKTSAVVEETGRTKKQGRRKS